MADMIRWGILGTGNIAHKFAQGLKVLDDADLIAVGSRNPDTAQAFADEFAVPRVHASYQQLVNDSQVDVIYVSTPHPFHMENTLLCINAGKAVLCEKPFAINADQASKMIYASVGVQIFLMEAMWTRFIPIIVQVRQWIEEGIIGQPRLVQADFGYRAPWDSQGRILNPELGGGSILDVGIYPLSLASMVYGQQPTHIAANAHIGTTGVDEQAGFILQYEEGQLAVLSCAVRTSTPGQAIICGTKGMIKILAPFWRSVAAVLCVDGKEDQLVEMPLVGNGYNYQAEEVHRCLRNGRIESDIISHAETVAIMKTMDTIRLKCGMKYPME